MHTSESHNSNVPAFLIKLWKLVEDGSCNDLISWSEAGTSFIIRDQAKFSKELLPLYFKHSNMASFIRQLNMYGFRKVANYEKGGLKAESDEIEFHHIFFTKGQASLLELIKRKMSSAKGNSGSENQSRSPNAKELLSDLTSIRKKQENMDAMLINMKKENEVLWQEISVLRNKHKTQEQIIQKVIHFLVSLVRSNQGLAPKRKLPRLLHDNSVPKSKTVKLTSKLGLLRGENTPLCFSVLSDKLESQSPQGPVIHEVTDFDIDGEEITPISAESEVNMLLNEDYPIITSSSPAEPDRTELQLSGTSAKTKEIISPVEQELTSIALKDLPPHEQELSVIASEVLLPPEHDATEQPVLISLNYSDDSENSVPLNAKLLSSPEGCFLIESGSDAATAVPSEQSVKQNLLKSNDACEDETDQINSETIQNIVGSTAEDISNYSSLFGGCAKDVLLSNNPTEDEEGGNQENNYNNLQLALSDPNPSSTSGIMSSEIISDHLFNIEEDLDWLQNQLRSGNLNIDSSTLLGVCQRWESWSSLDSQLFSADDVLNNPVLANQFAAENSSFPKEMGNDIAGNELVQFTAPSVLEADLNSVENPIFEYLNANVPLNSGEYETKEPNCDAQCGSPDNSSIKVNFQALMDTENLDDSMPSKSETTRSKKRPRRVK